MNMDSLSSRSVEVLQASLSPDPNIRHQAEAAIKEVGSDGEWGKDFNRFVDL